MTEETALHLIESINALTKSIDRQNELIRITEREKEMARKHARALRGDPLMMLNSTPSFPKNKL